MLPWLWFKYRVVKVPVRIVVDISLAGKRVYSNHSSILQQTPRGNRAAGDRQYLMARLSALLEFDLAQGNSEGFGDEFEQSLVGAALDGRGSQADLQGLPVQSGNFGAFRAGLDMQGQGENVAVAAIPCAHNRLFAASSSPPSGTIRRSWQMMNRISTERSTLPTGGMRRRNGCRNGRLTAPSMGASGVCGLTQDRMASASSVAINKYMLIINSLTAVQASRPANGKVAN